MGKRGRKKRFGNDTRGSIRESLRRSQHHQQQQQGQLPPIDLIDPPRSLCLAMLGLGGAGEECKAIER